MSNNFDLSTFNDIAEESKLRVKAMESPAGSYLGNYDPKTILKNPAFLNDLRDVYASQGKFFNSDSDLVDNFFSDKSWEEFNSISLAKGVAQSVTADDATKEKMARIQEVYDRFPNFWEEGGRSAFDALSDAIPAAILDPINLIPIGSAAKLGKMAAKAGKSAVAAGARDGALKVGVTEGTIGAGFGAAEEFRRTETGQTNEISLANIGIAAGLGAGLGGILGGAIGGVSGGITGAQTRQIMARKANLEDALPNLQGEEYANAINEIGQINRILESPEVNVDPTDAIVTPPPAKAAPDPEPEAPTETPLTPEEIGDQNLQALDEDLATEIGQLEDDMGLARGALADPAQRKAYMEDAANFDEALFKAYQELVTTRNKIKVTRASKNGPALKREQAQKAAEKGDTAKAEKLFGEADALQQQWDFYANAKLADIQAELSPEITTPRTPEAPEAPEPALDTQTARDVDAEWQTLQRELNINELDQQRTSIQQRIAAISARMLDGQVAREIQGDLDKLQEQVSDSLTPLEQFREKMKSLEVQEELMRKQDEAEMGRIAKEIEADPELKAEWERLGPDGSTKEEQLEQFRKKMDLVDEESKLAKKVDEARKTREQNEMERISASLKDDPELKAEWDKVSQDIDAYNAELKKTATLAKTKELLDKLTKEKAPAKTKEDELYKKVATLKYDPATKKYVPDTAKVEPEPEAPTTEATPTEQPDAPVSGLIDPGEPPEGMVLAIIKDGMTPRVPGPKQLQRLEGGEITRQQLLESLAGKDKDGWEVGFVPQGTQDISPNFMERFMRPGDSTPADNEIRTYEFDINERDNIPTYESIMDNEVELPVEVAAKIGLTASSKVPDGRGGMNTFTTRRIPFVKNVLKEIHKLESQKLRVNKKDQQEVFDTLDALYKALPAYKHSETTKAEAVESLIGPNGILGRADAGQMGTIRDILRRFDNKAGTMPIFTKGRISALKTYYSPRKSTGGDKTGITLATSGNDRADNLTVGHELFHWLYFNILTPTEKRELNQIVLDRIYDSSGRLDKEAMQGMVPFGLKHEGRQNSPQILEDQKFKKETGDPGGIYSVSRNTVQEILANQFSLFMADEMPQQANVFVRIARYVQAIIDRFVDGKRLDPDLAAKFNRLLPETAQDLLKGTGEATTNLGATIRDAVDELQALRVDLEKSMSNMTGVGEKRLQEHGLSIARFLSSDVGSQEIKNAISTPEIMAILKQAGEDLSTPESRLQAANLLVDAHTMMDANLKQAFKNAEGVNLAPGNPVAELPPQVPNTKGAKTKGQLAGLKQIEAQIARKEFQEAYALAKETGDRVQMEGVFLKAAGRMAFFAGTKAFQKEGVPVKNIAPAKRPRFVDYLTPIKDELYGMGQAPTSQMRDKFSQLSDEAFMKLADKKATELEEIFDNIDSVYVNATIRSRKAGKKAGNDVAKKKKTNRGKAKSTAQNRRAADEVSINANALVRTISDADIDAELKVSSTDKRAADLASEIERREAAQVPEDMEPAAINSRKVMALVRQEDIEMRGVQLDDGVPNNAPAMVREAIRKITHRDPSTQRMARGMMHRLINIADGDQLRLMNVTDPNANVAYNGEPFNELRNELRQLARSIGGTGKNKVQNARSAAKKIAELTLRAAPPDADRYAAIQDAFEFADDALKQGRSDAQWFQAHLQNAILGTGGKRPFLGPNAFEANEALEAAVESAAYLTNGFIRKGEMKNAMKPLLQYGDMFSGVPPVATPAKKLKERTFVEGGLGADENGNSVPWFHATPNTMPFGARDFVWRVSRASDNPRFGPGIYLGQSQEVLSNIYAKNPTLAAMGRMIEDMVPERDRDYANTIAYALSSTRMQINDLNMQMTRYEGLADDVILEEIGMLREAEEGLVETLSEMGLEAMPGVIETRVRAVSPIDIRNGVMYSIHHPDMKNMMDSVVQRGLVADGTIEDLANELAAMQGGFEGSVLYNRLVDEIIYNQGISEGAAKGELTAALQSLGYDSLRVTEQNRLPDSGVVEHEALVVFENKNVKSPDAEEFDQEAVFFHEEASVEEPTAPLGSLGLGMMDTGGKPDPNRMGAIIGEFERSGLAQGAQVLMKRIRGQDLTPQEQELLHKANPLKYLMNNANRLRNRHMHWLADWTKPREGAGFHEKEQNLLASKVLPLLNAISSVTGESPFTRWKNTAFANPLRKTPKQHPAAKAVVQALRRGERYAVENLSPEQLTLYNKVRSAFDAELQTMNDLGMGVGRITNYVPQIYDIDMMQTHQDEIIAVFAEMIRRDRAANPGGSVSAPPDPTEIAKQIMLRIVDDEGVYIPENKMRAVRNGKNPHTDYNRVLNFSAVDEMGRLKYGDLLDYMEKRGFLVSNLDGIVSKYFEGTNKKILFHQQFGTGNHGYHDYMVIRGGGARAAVELLSSNKVTTRKGLTAGDFGGVVADDIRITDIKGFDVGDAQTLVDNIVTGIASGTMTVPSIKKYLTMAKPDATQADLIRFEAVANALWEHENFGAVKQSAGDFSDAYFASIQGRNLEQTQRSRMARQASKAVRNFNSITLLSYTALTSMTDLAIPFMRGARMRDSMNVIRQSVGSGENAVEYRQAIANIGAAMESQVHSRMSMLYGSAGGRLTNQFFALNLLAPWTNLQRNMATATGYELLKAQQKIAMKNFVPGAKSQNRSYRTAKRMLSEFGLGEYLENGKTLDDLSLLDPIDGDPNVRMALHRFANETIFTPNKSDVPLWAQGPVGAVVFQLKSYPLMFQRLAGKIISETKEGNFTPLLNFVLLGSSAGAGTIAVKDIVQMRGGDDETSAQFRERKLSKILEKMGYNPSIHGPADDFLGWMVESQLAMGGFGLLGDMFHSVAAQADNGLYGATRISSTLLGPTSGTFLDAIQAGQGLYDQAANLTPESNAKERAAYRFITSRIPGVGGNRYFREGLAELLGGADEEKDKSANYSANYGSKYGSNYDAKY